MKTIHQLQMDLARSRNEYNRLRTRQDNNQHLNNRISQIGNQIANLITVIKLRKAQA